MTAAEACTLLVDVTQELSRTRADRDAWRLVALAQIERSSELGRELAMIDARSYVHRTRSQDARDLFLDQQDLRRQEAAA